MHQVGKLICGLLISSLSSSLVGCGVTSEVATTHPSASVSSSIEPAPTTPADYPITGGRPGAARPATAAAARVVARPAVAKPAASAEANAIAIGSPNRRIQSGRIVDEAGQPLVGATVLLKGTTRGASTDANGDYSLAVPLGTNTFVFAHTGYEEEVAQSRDGQPLTVTLLPSESHTAIITPEKESKPRKKRP